MKTHARIPILLVLASLAIAPALAGCAATPEQKAYSSRVAFNGALKAIVAARQAQKLDDGTYVTLYRTAGVGAAALNEADARIARIKQIENDVSLGDEQRAKLIGAEESALSAVQSLIERVLPELEKGANGAWSGDFTSGSALPSLPAPSLPAIEGKPDPISPAAPDPGLLAPSGVPG